MIWWKLFGKASDSSQMLYEKLVRNARQPRFYEEWGVPDTVDGRFDMIVLHVFLLLDRLKDEGEPTGKLRQNLTDTFFKDMDRSLREMGIGDLSVGKKVRKMAEACYGRLKAYAKAINEGEAELQGAFSRNIFAGSDTGDSKSLASWAIAARNALAQLTTDKVLALEFEFP